MRAASYEALFGLLAVSGMRIGEAIGTGARRRRPRRRRDHDPQSAKVDRARLVPLHPTGHPGVAPLRAGARPAVPAPRVGRVLSLQRRHTGDRSESRRKAFREITSRTRHPHRGGAPAGPRSETSFCGADPDRLAAIRASNIDERIGTLSTYLGHVSPADTYWYLSASPELMALAAERLDRLGGAPMSALAPALQAYFTDRLIGQRGASPNTIAAYSQTFRLLLGFAAEQTGKTPSALDIADLDAPLIAAFLDHLETATGTTASRTRNNRLAAIHSLFAYLALHHPEHAASIQRVLAIPAKRTERNLSPTSPSPRSTRCSPPATRPRWTGRRDHAMLALAIQTGLRISELAGLTRDDITLGDRRQRAHHRQGQERTAHSAVPDHQGRAQGLAQRAPGAPADPLFPDPHRQAPQPRRHRTAPRPPPRHRRRTTCPSLRTKHVTMHTLRHTAAMRLLLAGNDITVIALWLGHEQISTTNIYLHADMTHKQRAIDRTRPLDAKPGRYRPPDALLAFLEAL